MSSAIKFPSKICKNNVTNFDQAIQCDLNVILGFVLNAMTLIILPINSSEILMILGFVSHAAAKFSLSIL